MIYVCGCSSENNPDKFKKGDYVKAVVGNSNKESLVSSIENDDPDFKNNTKQSLSSRVTTKTRADLWVQNGCNNFCTYCLIPYLRGRETSFPLEDVEKQVTDKLMIEKLRSVLPQLSEDEQLLIRRHYYDNIPETELAKIYGISQQAISKRMLKIKAKLKNLMEN